MLWILWNLPIKLRYKDIEVLSDEVQRMRISEKELEEYIEQCKEKYRC